METICPLCKRVLTETSVSEHHLVPKTFKSRDDYPKCNNLIDLHKICHRKIHATFSERELLKYYHTIDRILENEDILNFVNWVKRKDPDFYDSSKETNNRKNKRRK